MGQFSPAAPRGMSAEPPWQATVGGSYHNHVTEGPPDGCKHSPSCFTCPLPDCMVFASPEPKPPRPKRPRGGGVGPQPKRYQCDVCGKLTSYLSGARSHLRQTHGGEGGFVTLPAYA